MSEYPTPPGDSLEPLVRQLRDLQRQLNDLQRPSGTNIAELKRQVQEALVNINATVIAATNLYLSTGTVSVNNLDASGQVTSAAPVKSPGSYNYSAGANRRTQWIDDTFQMGQTVSSVRYKKDFESMSAEDVLAFLSLQPKWGRYNWADPASPREAFLLAEDVAELGRFGQDILVLNSEGQPDGINYSQLVGPLLAVCRAQQESIHELSVRLSALDGGAVLPAVEDLPSAADRPVIDPVFDQNP